MQHARPINVSTKCQSTTSGTSSSSSGTTSSSESGSRTFTEPTGTETTSTRLDTAVEGTGLPWSATRTDPDPDSNNYGNNTSLNDNESFDGIDFNPNSGKHAASGYNGAELLLDPWGS